MSGELLGQAGHAIQPDPHRLASLDDPYEYTTSIGITRNQDQDSVLFPCDP